MLCGNCLVENGGEEDVQDHRDDDGGDQAGLVSPDVLGLSWAATLFGTSEGCSEGHGVTEALRPESDLRHRSCAAPRCVPRLAS